MSSQSSAVAGIACKWSVDQDGRIDHVGGAWEEFAEANGGDLARDLVVGRPLVDFLTGPEVRATYRLLMDRAREGNREVRIRLSCDGPATCRVLELTIAAREDGGFDFATRPVETRHRPPVPLLDARVVRHEHEIVRLCGWCNRVRDEESAAWLPADEAFARLDPFLQERPPQLSHGMCEDCFERYAV